MSNKFPNIYAESTAGRGMPLVDSHNNMDDRTTQDHPNDYWVDYDSAAPDPYSRDERLASLMDRQLPHVDSGNGSVSRPSQYLLYREYDKQHLYINSFFCKVLVSICI
jgi:hypothetical protein